jgi:DNA recombination protein RmuC
MTEVHFVIAALAVLGVLQVLLLLKKGRVDLSPILHSIQFVEKGQERMAGMVREEAARNREEFATTARESRIELASNLKAVGDSLNQQLAGFAEQLGKLTESNQQRFEALRSAVEAKLKSIQEDNARQLDQMRATVEEKLQGTLEKRLGESFKLVSERLEQVYRGLGEMQNLAAGVGDLKKVLTNVKTRGTWGEVQLGAMLEQVLSPDQYAANLATKEGGERVEFAIKLPGKGEESDEAVWLPIDAKFPIEDYQRLIEAQEKADVEAAEQAARQLEIRIKQCAKDICDKYISPPKTTDFAILFLPTEGLFAEAIRRVGLCEHVQRHCRVVIAGPTTLWSILNSLQMGFRTLTIQKRSSEVWRVLGAIKTEFGTFGGLLEGVKNKLDQASNRIDVAARKSRAIERKLRTVQELPALEAQDVLGIEAGSARDNGSADDV